MYILCATHIRCMTMMMMIYNALVHAARMSSPRMQSSKDVFQQGCLPARRVSMEGFKEGILHVVRESGVWVKKCDKIKYSHYCSGLDTEHCVFFEKNVIKQTNIKESFD